MVTATPSLDIGRFQQWVELQERRRALKAELDTVEEEAKTLETKIVDEMTQVGIQHFSLEKWTVYISTLRSASIRDGDKQRAVEALRSLGLEDMVTANYQSVSAWVREHLNAGQPLPPAFEAAFVVNETHKLAMRKK